MRWRPLPVSFGSVGGDRRRDSLGSSRPTRPSRFRRQESGDSRPAILRSHIPCWCRDRSSALRRERSTTPRLSGVVSRHATRPRHTFRVPRGIPGARYAWPRRQDPPHRNEDGPAARVERRGCGLREESSSHSRTFAHRRSQFVIGAARAGADSTEGAVAKRLGTGLQNRHKAGSNPVRASKRKEKEEISMRWFGESWGAPICDAERHAATPTSLHCMQCDGRIADGDQGLIVEYFSPGGVSNLALHRRCMAAAFGLQLW